MNKTIKKLITGMLVAAMLLSVNVPVSETNTAHAAAKKIKLSTKKLVIKTQKKYRLKVKNLGKKDKVTWTVTKGKNVISLHAKKRTSVRI
ncbi:MAG: hypothetical protein J6P16_00125, partial [Eubacterium sp.]|nr:hypothetical protein [Eubacterium sp.]